jgi:outer membrane lipoprotein-sorting protein
MKFRIFLITGLTALIAAAPLAALTGEEIIQRMQDNLVYSTARIDGTMTINDRFGEKTSSFISYSKGDTDMLLEFTSVEEKGQKVLRTGDELYLYYPDATEVIRLQGSALRDSLLGSDFSYEDMTGDRSFLETYQVALDGTEDIEGHACYRITLTARTRDVPYPKETVWVDKELFIYRKVEKYAMSGRLLKVMMLTDFVKRNGRVIPTGMLMKDVLKRNSSTEFRVNSIQIGLALPKDIFSLGELTW